MECYIHIRLLLQRDVLASCSGEANAHYNSVQAFFKIVLVEAWMAKIPYNELWGTIYSKGWGDPWHYPLWQFNYPHDSSRTLWLLHPTIDTWLTLDMTQHYNAHVLMWNNMAWASLARHHWHSILYGETNYLTCLWWWRWWYDARLGCPWWCACISWWHLVEVNSCLSCNQCIGSAPSSNLSTNMRIVILHTVEPETNWYIMFMLIFMCVLLVMHINLLKYMFSPSWNCFLSSPWWVCLMGWFAWVCSTTCMLLNPLHTINNTAHHVYSVLVVGMDP